MFGGKTTENMRCSLIVKCDLYAGKIWGGCVAPLLNLRCPLGLINLILPLGLWELYFLDGRPCSRRHPVLLLSGRPALVLY